MTAAPFQPPDPAPPHSRHSPHSPDPSPAPPAPGPGRARRARVLVGFLVGVALLIAAGWAVRGHRADFAQAWRSLRGADPVVWGLMLGLPLVSLVLTSECFLTLTRRFAPAGVRVPRGEMLALISAAWLLNFLPLAPGLFGRVAFHRRFHGIRVRDSARVVAEVMACGVVSLLLLTLGVLARPALGPMLLLGTLVLAPFLFFSTKFSGSGEGSPTVRAFLAALALKLLDSFAWAGRYLLAFQLVGRPVGLTEAIAVAVVVQASSLLPIAGNGLGIREWAVGLLAASLPAWFASSPEQGVADGLTLGLSAGLIIRAAEVAVALPVGLLAGGWLARRTGRGQNRTS